MKKTFIPLFILMFAFIGMCMVFAQQNSEEAKFQKALDSYLDELWKFYPTAATLTGYHNYDNKLEDLRKKNIEKRHEALDKFNQEFVAKVDQSKLSPDLQDDFMMIIDALEYELLKHEALLPWEYNPIFYNDIFINCIRSLLTKDFASLDTRAKNAVERIKNLPKLIKQAKENLKNPPQIYTEIAIKQFPAILDFYRNELPQLITQVPAAHKSKLESGLSKVIPELESYQSFLKNELLPRSTGNFRLGEAHRKLLRIKLQNNITLEELIARARADYNNIRREMFLVCIPFYKIMDPKFDVEHPPATLTEEQLKNTMISHVLDKIKGDHVPQSEFINKIKSISEEIKKFIVDNGLIDIPDTPLLIEQMPLENQGITWTRLSIPGVYETDGTYTCQISPLADDLTEEQVQSLLEEYNNYFLPFYVVRKVYPGELVPIFFARQNPSIVRKLYPNNPLIKGWPVFVEEMLVSSGFGNYDLRLRLNQLKYRLKAVIDFLLELNIHEGGMTKEQAIDYMMRGGFQTKAEAERKWDRIALLPGDATYAYVGIQELMEAEKEYQKMKGESFSRKEFLKKVLSFGGLHLRQLRKKIME